jgi:hypothetical protein
MTGLSRPAALTLAALCLSTVAACAKPGQATSPEAAPACQQPAEAVMPGAAGMLDETSAGAYCLPVGSLIDVFLHAKDPKAARWSAVASSDPSVLQPQRTGVLTPVVGVTPGIFGGMKAGQATLSSVLPGGSTWSVTIVVR